jgi:hypothetical protein
VLPFATVFDEKGAQNGAQFFFMGKQFFWPVEAPGVSPSYASAKALEPAF